MAYVLHHVGMSCNDPIALERWYTKHFGFKRGRVYAPGEGQVVMIQAGGVYLELFSSTEERPAPKVEGAGPDYSGFRHLAFLVSDLIMSATYTVVRTTRARDEPAARRIASTLSSVCSVCSSIDASTSLRPVAASMGSCPATKIRPPWTMACA